MRTKSLLKRLSWLFAILIIGAFAQPNPYLRRSLWYLSPGIYDYTIFSNAIINTGTTRPWPVKNNTLRKLSPGQIELLQKWETSAFLIISHDTLIASYYALEHSDTTLSNSFSAAKSVVALLIGIAHDKGFISSLNDPIGKYIGEYNTTAYRDLTVKNLLNMTSGLAWKESYCNPFSMTTKAYYGNNLHQLVCPLKVREDPGNHWEYLSANTQLLAIILQNATKKSVPELTEEWLWKPVGAKYPAKWSMDHPDGMVKAYCCFNATAPDFARIGDLVLHQGIIDKDTLLSPDFLDEATTANNQSVRVDNKPVDFYGYQWWIANGNNYHCIYARGILGQYIAIVPEKHLIMVRLGHKRSKQKVNHHPVDFLQYLELALTISE